ncbi:CHAT domain-containing protein [Aquimarina mytili]|uniref:CHAT domain-containing protein n=1 Tax=Aquimarina mytili TaxID=874423 RepID=A0A936ZU79_9FLAO|nr:CHAT domain-containing protein [Aquimarina mytili]MBL0682110.1 CHAT domain-containing protein [Aquimarina mytili]
MTKRFLPHKILIVLFLTFFCCIINAQISKDTLQAHYNYIKADSLFKEGKYQESISLYQNAAVDFKNKSYWRRYAQALNEVSLLYYRLGDLKKSSENIHQTITLCREKLEKESIEESRALGFKGLIYSSQNHSYKALGLYKKALSILEKKVDSNDIKIASLFANIGVEYDKLGLIDQTQENYEKALKINQYLYDQKKYNELSTVYLNLAILYSGNGLFNKAIPYYNKAIALDKEEYGEKHPYIADSYYNLGLNYSYIGETYLSLQYYNMALEIFRNAYAENSDIIASCYESIATKYIQLGKQDEALKNYNKALDIYSKNYGDQNFNTANIIANIGEAYSIIGDYTKALHYLKKSYKIHQGLFDKDHRNMFLILNQFGLLYKNQQNYTLANEYYTKSLGIAIQNFGEKNQKTAESYINIADVEYLNHNFSTAANNYHKAIIAGTKSFKDSSLSSLPNTDDYINVNTLLNAVYGKAKAIKSLAKKNNSEKELELSLSNFTLCDALIDKTRNSYVSIEDKVLLASTSSKIYKEAIATSLVLHQKTKDDSNLENAFYFSEKNRARLLEEQLRKTKAQQFAEIPEEKLSLIENTRTTLALYKTKLYENSITSEKKDSITASTYSNLVFTLTQKNDSLMKRLELEYPKYHELKYDNSIISISDIQQNLPEKTTILEYFVTDDIIYGFLLSKNDFSVQEIKVSNLDKKILQLHKAITNKDIDAYREIAFTLYQELIQPFSFEKKNQHLIIIPDGMLWQLNFDVLLTEESGPKNPKELPYFLKTQVISYANSANLLFKKKEEPKAIIKECLAFSFSDTTSLATENSTSFAVLRSTDDDLPGTRKEIKAISDIIDGAYFYGKNAIEENFKQNAHQYALLHLALHGELDNENPENSKLYFTQVQDSTQDNYLYNHELYALKIPAELAVLSACNTGTGKISKGEGVMSLGRAFQYAGTRSLVLTNWEVSDETTPELMKNFYTNLKKGMNKAQALQQAKLQYLENADIYTSNPFYWGGFYLIGDTSTIDFQDHKTIYTYLAIAVFVLIFLLGLFYIKAKNKKLKVFDKS